MIHEIGAHRLDNAFRNRQAERGDFAFCFDRDGACFFPPGNGTFPPRMQDYPEQVFPDGGLPPAEYLFAIDGSAFFLLPEAKESGAEFFLQKAGWQKKPPSVFRTLQPGHMGFAGITAKHIALWRFRHRFCGRCGARTQPSKTERAEVCPACLLTVYPEIMPAVITAVTDGDRLLMARSKSGTYPHFALIAGFTEIGETLEQTVVREVREETGLRVKNIRYAGSQPWGFSGTQMTAFFAELDGSPEIRLQESELAEARWFARADIPLPPDEASIGGMMIRLFKEQGKPDFLRAQDFQAPVL